MQSQRCYVRKQKETIKLVRYGAPKWFNKRKTKNLPEEPQIQMNKLIKAENMDSDDEKLRIP